MFDTGFVEGKLASLHGRFPEDKQNSRAEYDYDSDSDLEDEDATEKFDHDFPNARPSSPDLLAISEGFPATIQYCRG